MTKTKCISCNSETNNEQDVEETWFFMGVPASFAAISGNTGGDVCSLRCMNTALETIQSQFESFIANIVDMDTDSEDYHYNG